MAKAVGEKPKAWNMIDCIKIRGEQPPTSLKQLYGQKKKAARRAVGKARRKNCTENCTESLTKMVANR